MNRSSLIETAPDAAMRPDEPSDRSEPAPLVKRCTWTIHPARHRIPTALLAGSVIVGAGVLVGAAAQNVIAGSLAAALLVASLRNFFFPTTYVVDDRGVAVRCLGRERRQSWERLRRFRYDARGAFLSTRSRSNRLDAWTALHLEWNANADEIVPVIERAMNREGGP